MVASGKLDLNLVNLAASLAPSIFSCGFEFLDELSALDVLASFLSNLGRLFWC